MALSTKRSNIPLHLGISIVQKGTLLIIMVALILNSVSAAKPTKTIAPSSTAWMDDPLFKNLSDSFSKRELEDAMISLNRTKRQSLNLQQLALLAGLNNAGGGAAVAATGQNTSNNGAVKQSTESLLSSCQLTNLLLYQLLQQRQQAAANPFLSLANANLQGLGSNLNLNVANGAAAGGLINPFPAINQNLIFPAETLKTYTTTTTYVTKLTTTAVITIPLLFGNKPVPTTITRTKTYDVTTSEVQTLTSTVKPTYVTQVISATPVLQSPVVTSSPSLNDVEEEEEAQSLVSESVAAKKFPIAKASSPEYEDEEPVVSNTRGGGGSLHSKLSKSSNRNSNASGKRRKPGRSSQSQKSSSNSRSSSRDRDYQDQGTSRYGSTSRDRGDDYYETDYQPYAATSSTKKGTTGSGGFSKRKYGNIYEDDVAVDEDPAAAQYPDDYSYYTRRLKRGEQYGDEGEYQLEPSTDGDFSSNYQKYERCPPIPKQVEAQTVTVTRTETRTVTKFLGQSTLASNINLNGASRTYETPKPSRKRNRSRTRSTSSDQAAAYTAPAPTTESRTPSRGTTEDSRAQILLRSRSRYNSNPNNNNNNYQQPNYDYYRG